MVGRAKPDTLAQAVKLARRIMSCMEKRHAVDHDDVSTLCRLVVDLEVARLEAAVGRT